MPEKGRYEVFFNHVELINPEIHFSATLPKGDNLRYYTVFDGKKEHEIISTTSENTIGSWVSLGVFDFSKNARVTLSDKSINENSREELVADAVKWVKVKE